MDAEHYQTVSIAGMRVGGKTYASTMARVALRGHRFPVPNAPPHHLSTHIVSCRSPYRQDTRETHPVLTSQHLVPLLAILSASMLA